MPCVCVSLLFKFCSSVFKRRRKKNKEKTDQIQKLSKKNSNNKMSDTDISNMPDTDMPDTDINQMSDTEKDDIQDDDPNFAEEIVDSGVIRKTVKRSYIIEEVSNLVLSTCLLT